MSLSRTLITGVVALGLSLAAATVQAQPVLYVDDDAAPGGDGSSWNTAFQYLQDALAAASASGGTVTEIRVAAGTYKPDQGQNQTPGDRTATFQLLDGVALNGGYAGLGAADPDAREMEANETILSGDLAGDDGPDFSNVNENSYHIVTVSEMGATPTLDGFTVQGGNGKFSHYGWGSGLYCISASPMLTNCTFRSNRGGGMYNDSGSPVLNRCHFVANLASNETNSGRRGAGFYSTDGQPILTDCTFINNRADNGAGMYMRDNVVVQGCVFRGNSATEYGGGMSAFGTSTIIACLFEDNSADQLGGGLFLDGGVGMVKDSKFFRNYAYSGGATYNGGSLTLVNCILSGNGGFDRGGAIQNTKQLYLINSALTNNSVTDNGQSIGGGIYNVSWGYPHCTIRNSILWSNQDSTGTTATAQLYDEGNSTINVTHCCVQGSWPGQGNIDIDPLFSALEGVDGIIGTIDDNLRLSTGSPCIDAGDNNAVADYPTDLDGHTRIIGGTVDMGPYEQMLILQPGGMIDIPEGDTTSMTVAMREPPAAPILMHADLLTDDPDLTIQSGDVLTFNADNYAVPQPVVIAAANDADYLPSGGSLSLTVDGVVYAVVSVRELDSGAPSALFVDASAPPGGDGTSWATAFNNLQEAQDAVVNSGGTVDEIWVRAGTYRPTRLSNPTDPRSASFQLISGVALYGGFEGNENQREQRDPATNITMLSGDLAGNDGDDFANNSENAYHVVVGSNVDATAIIDGFTISAGNANGPQESDKRGGGMYLHTASPTVQNCYFDANRAKLRGSGLANDFSSPKLTDCTFFGNQCDGLGGGLDNYYSGLIVERCVFIGNAARNGGAMSTYACSPELRDCHFEQNTASGINAGYGGAVLIEHQRTKFTNCIFTANNGKTGGAVSRLDYGAGDYFNCQFTGNHASRSAGAIKGNNDTIVNCVFDRNTCEDGNGGAVLIDGFGSHATIINSLFSGNAAPENRGGALCVGEDGLPVVVNCVFSGNRAMDGAAIMNSSSNLTLTNCTLYANDAGGTGGGIYNYRYHTPPAVVIATNCIFWANTDTTSLTVADQQIAGGEAIANYSCIQGSSTDMIGEGLIDVNPLLIDPDGADDIIGTQDDDLRLAANSPCLDAGDNLSVPIDTLDLDGDGDTSEPLPVDAQLADRFLDELDIPDTGQGNPPIVDIGAYEGACQGFLVPLEPVQVPEGGTATFEVTLSQDPDGTIIATVTHHAGDPDITVLSGSSLTFDSSNFSQPQFVTLAADQDADLVYGQAIIRISAPGIPSADVIAEEVDDEAQSVLYVDAAAPDGGMGLDWATAFNDLQDALAAAGPSGGAVSEIWVAAGTYTPAPPNGDREATFSLVNGVAVYGGFAGTEINRGERDPAINLTILSGDLNGDDLPKFKKYNENSYHVVTAYKVDGSAVLDGVIVTGGSAVSRSFHENGGGMYIRRASPTISHCTFTANRAYERAGGIFCFDHSNPKITRCDISGNIVTHTSSSYGNGGGICCEDYSSPEITDCIINQNQAGDEGGGLSCRNESNPKVINCDISENWSVCAGGGGIFIVNSSPEIRHCVISNNRGTDGGGLYTKLSGSYTIPCAPVISECLISNNEAKSRDGGGIYLDGSTASIVNCTVSGNEANLHGGGIYSATNESTIANCMISDNIAEKRGGGIYGGTAMNCVIVGNSATYGGGITGSAVNCTIIRNKADSYGGGCSPHEYSDPTLTNCILWDNEADKGPEIAVANWNSALTVSYCDIRGGREAIYVAEGKPFHWGAGNIDANPLFLDPNGPDGIPGTEDDNLRLLFGSSCIDAGDNDAVPEGIDTDLDGNPRIVDGDGDGTAIVDMGAYEAPEPIIATLNILPGDGPNPFVPNKKSQGRIPMAILGSEELAAEDIDTESIKIAGIISPVKTSTDKDVDGDGLVDLVMHFNRRDLIDALSLDTYEVGTVVDINVTATRKEDGWPIVATDNIVIVGP